MRIITVAPLISFVTIMAGCASSLNLSDRRLSLERIPNPKTYFRQIWVEQSEDDFRVYGTLCLNNVN